MTNLNENEMVAIAARLWEPGQTRFSKATGKTVMLTAPDMRDPANLWRALENLSSVIAMRWLFDEQPDMSGKRRCAFYIQHKAYGLIRHDGWRLSMIDAACAALLALYKAEHPQK